MSVLRSSAIGGRHCVICCFRLSTQEPSQMRLMLAKLAKQLALHTVPAFGHGRNGLLRTTEPGVIREIMVVLSLS